MTCCSAPGASVNVDWLTLTPGSVARRFGDTLPVADCVHGRGVTVTAIGAADRLATVSVVSAPGCGPCSMIAGIIESPPVCLGGGPAGRRRLPEGRTAGAERRQYGAERHQPLHLTSPCRVRLSAGSTSSSRP